MRTSRIFPVLLAVCAFVAGAAPGAQAQKPTMDGYPAAGAQPVITVLAPGAAPRRQLRYAIPANQKARMEMTMTMSMAMNMAGMPMPMDLPTMKMGIDLAVTNVAANGDITYDMAFTTFTMDGASDPGTAGGAIATAMQTAAAGITSIKGSATISSRGVTKSTHLEVGDPTMKQMLAQMTTSIENLSMPFPEDALGVGARWEVRQALSAGGQTVFQKTEYEIVSVEGSTVSLKVKNEQTAPAQPVSNPDLPAGAEMNLEKMSGSGTGTVVIQLTSLVPTSAMESTSSSVMTMSMGGQSQPISVDAKLKITVAPGK